MSVTAPGGEVTAEQPPGTRRGGAARDVLVVLGSMLVLAVVAGVAWRLLVHPAEFTAVRGGVEMDELELGKRFSADGWYVVLAAVLGLPAGVALTWWRSRDALLTSLLLVVGSALAAAVTALVGHLLGPPDPETVLAAGRIGARAPAQLTVSATSAYLAWPIAVLLGSLLVLWSKPLEPEL